MRMRPRSAARKSGKRRSRERFAAQKTNLIARIVEVEGGAQRVFDVVFHEPDRPARGGRPRPSEAVRAIPVRGVARAGSPKITRQSSKPSAVCDSADGIGDSLAGIATRDKAVPRGGWRFAQSNRSQAPNRNSNDSSFYVHAGGDDSRVTSAGRWLPQMPVCCHCREASALPRANAPNRPDRALTTRRARRAAAQRAHCRELSKQPG